MRSLNRGGRDDARSNEKRTGDVTALLHENELAWAVVMRVFGGRQFRYRIEGAAAPMGGAFFTSVPDAFDYGAVIDVIKMMAPRARWNEVWEKVGWVEPYALNALRVKRAGGSNGAGHQSSGKDSGRRNRGARAHRDRR